MITIKNSPEHWLPIWNLYQDPLNNFTRIMREKGDLVRIRTPFSFYLVNEPNLINHILETSNDKFGKNTLDYRLFNRFLEKGIVSTEGERWQTVSNLGHPHFTRAYNEQLMLAIQQGLVSTISEWESHAEQGRSIDLGHDLARLCFRIACQILFGTQTENYEVADYLEHVEMSTFDGFALLLKYLPNKGSREHSLFHHQFENLINELGKIALKNKCDCLYTSLSKSLTHKQLIREMKVFLFGSHATLSNLLTWTFYYIANNPAFDQSVGAELSAVNPDYNDFSFIPEIKFTSQLIKEIMRFYPPVWMITRNCRVTHEFENHLIPKGSSFMIVPWTLHRNPRYWPNPDEFNPQRFASESGYNKTAFLPFSDGPRKCMGKRLAVMEIYMITAQLLKKFKLSVANTEKIDVINCLSPKSSSRIRVKIETRRACKSGFHQTPVVNQKEVV